MKADDATILIRPMNAVDLRRGFLETVRALRETNLTQEQAVAVFRRRMRNKVRTFVALIDGKVVGTASLLIEPKFIHDGGVTGHVEDVAVHPECQGRGIGGAARGTAVGGIPQRGVLQSHSRLRRKGDTVL